MTATDIDHSSGERGLAARKTAARLLAAIVDARTSLDGLTDNSTGHPRFLVLDARDRALVRAILVTALRFRCTIDKLIADRLDRPLPANAHALKHVLHIGAAQILFLDVPDSAAVNLAVAHAKSDPRTSRFGALVNAVLRGVARRKDRRLQPTLDKLIDAPDWFSRRLSEVYGHRQARAIFEAHRLEAPVDFTVKSDPDHWAGKLAGRVLPTGSVRVGRPAAAIADLPGYEQGAWWVQDTAASLPARLFGPVEGLHIADLCAAPGGKTAQLAHAGAKVTAFDISANRLKRLEANLSRLGLEAEIVNIDLLKEKTDRRFDAVLLDAPCSSTGTVRRHPDIPWVKSPEDIDKLAGVQRRLLERAVELVRPAGRLVFSNCSLDPREGEDLFDRFLREMPMVEADPIRPGEVSGADDWITAQGSLRTTPAGLQLETPDISGLDGFFAARMRRAE